MLSTSASDSRDPSLVELVQYSSKALLRKPIGRSPEIVTEPHEEGDRSNLETQEDFLDEWFQAAPKGIASSSYAAPLAPMRERDLKALAELFMQEAIDEIAADIAYHLLNRFPELCWEEDIFDFLVDYL